MTQLERYNLVQSLLNCKMSEGSSVSAHVLKIMGIVKQLEKLDYFLPKTFVHDLLLISLPASYSAFMVIYHMHEMDKSLEELHGMLRTFELYMKENVSHVLAVQERGKKIKKGKGKRKMKNINIGGKGKAHGRTTSVTKTQVSDECFYCKDKGHWKRNCSKYLEDLKNGNISSSSGRHEG